jgi:hypothetical protein
MGDIINIPNFENQSVANNYMPPAGDYLCEIPETPQYEAKEGKTPTVKVKHTIVAAKNQAQKDEEGNTFTSFVLAGVAPSGKDMSWKFKQLLVAAGIIEKDDKTSEIARGQIALGVLKGAKTMVRITHKMYTDPTKQEGPKEKYEVEYLIGG